MEYQQVRCPKCHKVIEIKTALLRPYSGQTVKIVCTDPLCKTPFKLTVPVYVEAPGPEHGPKVESTMFDPSFSRDSGSSEQKNNEPESERVGKVLSARINVLKNVKTAPQVFVLREGINTIGRLSKHTGDYVPDIAIVTSDAYISKKHCQITMVKNRKNGLDIILKDAGSANGTFLNHSSKPLDKEDEMFLNDADTILIGETLITFELR